MNIVLSRIDDRFIHGQVLTKWIKVQPIERIIVVSDEVASDAMRKTLILSVAPANVKASAVSVTKMAVAYKSPRYENTNVMLLFEGPRDVERLIEAGVPIKEVNVGGMRFEIGRKQITKAVSITEEDYVSFQNLDKKNVKLELRQLPGDESKDFIKIVEKEMK